MSIPMGIGMSIPMGAIGMIMGIMIMGIMIVGAMIVAMARGIVSMPPAPRKRLRASSRGFGDGAA